MISFTDRPLRIAHESMGITAERTINKLFKEKSSNSFTVDPPNAILSTSNSQATFEIKKVNVYKGTVEMTLKYLENKKLKNYNGRLSLFIDGMIPSDKFMKLPDTLIDCAGPYPHCCIIPQKGEEYGGTIVKPTGKCYTGYGWDNLDDAMTNCNNWSACHGFFARYTSADNKTMYLTRSQGDVTHANLGNAVGLNSWKKV